MDYKSGKWAKKILELQHTNGSWELGMNGQEVLMAGILGPF
jgi:hypothetical protein